MGIQNLGVVTKRDSDWLLERNGTVSFREPNKCNRLKIVITK